MKDNGCIGLYKRIGDLPVGFETLICYGKVDFNNKGHENDIVPYYIGEKVNKYDSLSDEVYFIGEIISNTFDDIANFLENRIIKILKDRIIRKDGYWIFNKYESELKKTGNMTYRGLCITETYSQWSSTHNKLKYDIKDIDNIKIKRPKFKNDKDKYNYLCDVAEIIDTYYLKFYKDYEDYEIFDLNKEDYKILKCDLKK